MDFGWWIALAAVAVVVVVSKLLAQRGQRHLLAAIKGGDVSGLRAALRKRSAFTAPAAYNRAIRGLWDAYRRDLAAPLIRDLGERFGEVFISQYWMRQLLTVEPGLARANLDPEFLQRHYQDEVAQKCGSFG